MGVLGEVLLNEIEKYYSEELVSIEDVHKNPTQRHKKNEDFVKNIVKEKGRRIEDEMNTLMLFARTRLQELKNINTGTHHSILDEDFDTEHVLASIREKFGKHQEHSFKKFAEEEAIKHGR